MITAKALTIFVRWNPITRRYGRVATDTPGSIEMIYSKSIGRYVTIPQD